MTAQGAHKITEEFEAELCRYTGAPYAVAVDNCSNALFLALVRKGAKGREVSIPSRTYPSVPCAIIHAGGHVRFWDWPRAGGMLQGAYDLEIRDAHIVAHRSRIVDSALRFTASQYRERETQCLSFTGPHKILKLGKGGAILTDSREDYEWYKRARFSGRRECSYHDDQLDMLGWNFYMLPEIAARGIALMAGFWRDGKPVQNEDLCLPFPDLSQFPVYTQPHDEALRYIYRDQNGEAGAFIVLDHVGAQSANITREHLPPIRYEVPPPAEPCPDYDAYRGNP